jgi:hypothetical protein
MFDIGKTVGVGLTITVKLCVAPIQLYATGKTCIIAVSPIYNVLVAVKEGMLPTPTDAIPILGIVLVQLYTVAPTMPVKLIDDIGVPLHTVSFDSGSTLGTGFTVMENVCG